MKCVNDVGMQTHNFDLNSLRSELIGLTTGETNTVANLANISSQIFHSLPNINWCGFYLYESANDELVLGPFQGKPACLRIRKGKGVCGTAWAERRPINVPDVMMIENHIACDPASRSELVVPIFGADGRFEGVLDIDSSVVNGISAEVEKAMIEIVKSVIEPLFKTHVPK